MQLYATTISGKDAYRLWTHPVVVGSGQRLVRDGHASGALKQLERHAYGEDVVVLSYQPATGTGETTPLLPEDRRPADGQSISDLALAMLGMSLDRDVDGPAVQQ